jgi:aminopeptidase
MPIDPRARKLAQLAVRYSVAVKPGQKVIVSGDTEAIPFLIELYKEIILQKAHPIVRIHLPDVNDFFYKYATKEQLEYFPKYWFDTIKKADAYIGVDTDTNTRELTSCDPAKQSQRQKITSPISHYICNTRDKIHRVSIAFPCISHAQDAEMSLNEWENFVYTSCLIDWPEFGKQLDRISKIFEKGKQVHLLGENVDLKFLIEGKNSIADKGEENMPGGEIYMAPVRTSMNGWIKFEYPAIYAGKEVTDISLKFKDGKVTEFNASKNKEMLKSVLETDKNSCYVGEFGIGCNPNVNKFTKSLLFDEKISGTIHLALGMAYKDNGGGNDSAVHWDIVKDMHKAKIILDGKIVQENGKWKMSKISDF